MVAWTVTSYEPVSNWIGFETVCHIRDETGMEYKVTSALLTSEGDILNEVLEAVAKLSVSELPVIPGIQDTRENLRRVAGLHRELSRLCGGKKYFLTCRDAAKVCPSLSHQKAYSINLALAQLGVIEVVRAGDPRPGGRASYYRYPLPESRNGDCSVNRSRVRVELSQASHAARAAS
jgi:hypothetical protein